MMSEVDDTESRTAATTERRHFTSTVQAFDMEIDENTLPELSSFVSAGAFWWKFAAWPLVLCVVNQIVFDTVVAHAGLEDYHIMRTKEMNGENTYLSMLRYNATVYAIILFLDAGLFYFAAKCVEKDVAAFDDLQTQDSMDATIPNRLDAHVHAQVSRRLDVILGRGTRPRDSIFISLLLLASTSCTAFAFMSIADWCFTWTPVGAKVCISRFSPEYERTMGDMEGGDMNGIPKELQPWAKRRYENSFSPENSIVRLNDGTSYIAAAEPVSNRTMDASNSAMRNDPWFMRSSGRVLVAISSKGTIEYFSNVTRPESFVIPFEADMLHTPVFCGLYEQYLGMEEFKGATIIKGLFCADSSGVQAVSLDTMNTRGQNLDRRPMRMKYASLRWFNNCFWVKVVWFGKMDRFPFVEYYNTTVEEGKPLLLVPVHSTVDSYSMIDRETISCHHWRKFIAAMVLVVVFAPVAFWLRQTRSMSVGVVPAIGALAALFYCINIQLAIVVCTVLAAVSFLRLQGCTIPLTKALRSEELVWVLYTSLVASGNIAIQQPNEFVLFVFIACVVVGSLLGHPALFLAGWIGGIVLVWRGTFEFLVDPRLDHLAWIAAGVIGGVGCVTVGKVLITYQAYVRYYTKWTCHAIVTRLQSVAPNNIPQPRRVGGGASMTTGLLSHDN